MGRVERSVAIRASSEKIWEMLALDRWSEWLVGGGFTSLQMEGVKFTSEVKTPEDKYRVGAVARPKREETFTVTESLKNEKITYLLEDTRTGNTGTITLVLEPIEDRTKLTYAVSYEMPWGAFGKFLEKLFAKRMGEGQLEKSLEKLKSILEK